MNQTQRRKIDWFACPNGHGLISVRWPSAMFGMSCEKSLWGHVTNLHQRGLPKVKATFRSTK